MTPEPAPVERRLRIRTFVAIGDSFTEGLDDPRPDGEYSGWADRLADRLSAVEPDLRYANLAVRGKLLDQIVAEQLPPAVAAAADLIGFSAGGNDILRPGGDPDAIAATYEDAIGQLRASGAQVLCFTGADPRGVPVLGRLRGKIATFNEHLRLIAARHGCVVVDMWAMPALHDRRAWAQDRIHLSPEGHAQVALLAAAALADAGAGLSVEADPMTPWPEPAARTRAQVRREHVQWARSYLAPWVGRRLRGRSSGDGLSGKRPELTPWPGESETA